MNYTFKIISADGTENEVMIKSRSTMLNINMLKKVKKSLPENTLYGTLYIPEGIETIDNMALTGVCGKIKTIILPSTVENIYRHAFYFPLCVEKIIVPDDNPYFSSDKNGILFNKDKTILIRYPIGRNDDYYTIPPTVTEIAAFAFAQTKVKFLTATKSVSTIGEQAFQYSQLISADFSETKIEVLPKECFWCCSNLINISLPKRLKSIGIKCFCQCGFEQINLPDTITKIEKYSFVSSKLKSIVLPRDLKTIRMGVFQDCEQFETANINNVTKIHKTAFTDCFSLSEITASPRNRKFSTKDGALYKDFTKLLKVPPAYNKEKFVVPDTARIVDEAAFDSCVNLVEIDIGNALLEDSAIFSCPNNKKIIIGSGCKEFSPEKVKLCFALEEITVDPDNPYYKSVDGVLFNKSGESLILYPCAKGEKTYTVPDGVVNISDSAFYNANNLTEVHLPDSVKEIGKSAFELCKNLKKINLARTAKIGFEAFCCCETLDNISLNKAHIGNYAFAFCSNLESIKLNGCQVSNNTFMLTPFNGNKVDYATADETELVNAFITANAPADFLLYPRYFRDNFWGW